MNGVNVATVGISPFFRTTQRSFASQFPAHRVVAEIGKAMDTDEYKLPRDPEDRAIDECSPEQRRDKEMDKTLADSFPASDPPAWQPECEKSYRKEV